MIYYIVLSLYFLVPAKIMKVFNPKCDIFCVDSSAPKEKREV